MIASEGDTYALLGWLLLALLALLFLVGAAYAGAALRWTGARMGRGTKLTPRSHAACSRTSDGGRSSSLTLRQCWCSRPS